RRKKMPERYPGYDVLNKRNSVSWNDKTREVIDSRLAIDPNRHLFFTDEEWPTVRAVCDRIVPQTVARLRPVPLAAMLDDKLHKNGGDGMPNCRRCAKPGGAASPRSMLKRRIGTGGVFTISVRSSRTRSSKPCSKPCASAPGTICRLRAFSK